MLEFLLNTTAWNMETYHTACVLLLFCVHSFILLGKWCRKLLLKQLVLMICENEQYVNIVTLAGDSFVRSELRIFRFLCLLFPNTTLSRISDGFQWSYYQQANHVINVVVGSDVSLPCEYLLTPQEQNEANLFHLLTWTREEPFGSENWAGLAVKSTLTGSKVIYDDPQHIFIANNTLQVTNVSVTDHTRYQCSFQSSFFTSPSTIELNVQCKYATAL